MAKILVMDDEPSLRNILASTVTSMGHTAVQAEGGKQAIEVAKKENPEIALLDFQVPDMDGLEVLKELKTLNPAIKCIMLSGSADIEMAVVAMKKGATDLIGKPFKIDEIKAVITKVLQKKSAEIPTLSKVISPSSPAQAQAPQQASQPPQQQSAPSLQAKPAPKAAATAPKDMKKIFIGAGAVIGLVLAAVLFKGIFLKSTFKEISIPYKNPSGMSYITPNLWVSDWISGNIYKHKIDDNLSIDSVYKTANTQPSGIAYTGDNLWSCNSVEKRIYKHALDQSLTVQAIFATPNCNPIALYFDGANLWVLDGNSAKIYKHKMDDTLSVLAVYDSPAPNPCGMFKNGDFFYLGDYKTSKVYKLSTKDLTVSEVFVIEDFANKNLKMSGITWDGKYIWASADENNKIFCMSFNKLKAIKF